VSEVPEEASERLKRIEAKLAVLVSPTELADRFAKLEAKLSALAAEVAADTQQSRSQTEVCRHTLDELADTERVIREMLNPTGRDYGEVLREIHDKRERVHEAYEVYEPLFHTLVEAYAEMMSLMQILAASWSAGTQRLGELLAELQSGLPSLEGLEPRPGPGNPRR